MATTNQPGFTDYNNEWSSGLGDCCSDVGSLFCVLFCTPCFLMELDKAAGECCCTSLLCHGAPLILRGKIRGHYKIRGAIYEDILALSCCGICALLQMKKQLEN